MHLTKTFKLLGLEEGHIWSCVKLWMPDIKISGATMRDCFCVARKHHSLWLMLVISTHHEMCCEDWPAIELVTGFLPTTFD